MGSCPDTDIDLIIFLITSVSVLKGLHIEDVNFLLITCSFKLTCEAGYKYENKSSEFICQCKAV